MRRPAASASASPAPQIQVEDEPGVAVAIAVVHEAGSGLTSGRHTFFPEASVQTVDAGHALEEQSCEQ